MYNCRRIHDAATRRLYGDPRRNPGEESKDEHYEFRTVTDFGDLAGAVEIGTNQSIKSIYVLKMLTAKLLTSTHQKDTPKKFGCENSIFGGVVICLRRI